MHWIANDFAERVYERQRATGKKLKDAAIFCGLKSPSSLSAYFRGDGMPGIDTLIKLADFFEVSPAWLCFGDQFSLNEQERDWVQRMRGCDPVFRHGMLLMLTHMTSDIVVPPAVLASLNITDGLPVNVVIGSEREARIAAAQTPAHGLHITRHADTDTTTLELHGSVKNASRRRNTRADFPTFHPTHTKFGKRRPIPRFLQLAAGPGRTLERCEDFHAFREYVPKSGINAATVQGHSMLDTVRHGETILLQTIDDGQGTSLKALIDGNSKTPYANFKQHVRDDEIWVLAINDEEPTLKRVAVFDPHGDWSLTITADNPETRGYPRPIRAKDEVTFFAKMIGYVDRKE